MVTHGHFTVDGKKITIPSQNIKVNQVISLKEKSRKNEQFKKSFFDTNSKPLPYLQKNEEDFSGKLISMPQRKEIPVEINDQMVVEFYSK